MPTTVKVEKELWEALLRNCLRLPTAEEILRELAYGYQSRKAYNELIAKANKYFEEVDK